MDTLEQEIFFDPAAVAAQAEGEWVAPEGDRESASPVEALSSTQVSETPILPDNPVDPSETAPSGSTQSEQSDKEEDVQITVQAVNKKTGSNNKGPWERTGVQDQDGNWHGTFSKIDVVEGGTYEVDVEQNGSFSNIKSISPVAATSNGTGPTNAVSQDKWDEIGFRKTLSQQLAAVFGTDAAVTALLSADDSQRIQYAAHLATVAHNNAIKVVTVEVPTKTKDSDIPF